MNTTTLRSTGQEFTFEPESPDNDTFLRTLAYPGGQSAVRDSYETLAGTCTREPFDALFRRSNARIAEALRKSKRYLGIYSAGIGHAGKGLLLAGATGVGKTTIALELAGRGYALLGDETTIYDRTERRVFPLERPLMIRSESFPLLSDPTLEERCRHFGFASTDGTRLAYHVSARDLFGASAFSPPVYPRAIVHLEREGPGGLVQFSTARYICSMSSCFYLQRPTLAAAMRVLADFANVSVYRLSPGTPKSAADAIVELLDAL
ncbi:MAG: hypothetical protein ACYDGM_03655 [Vulcanimicrobiaceae bacterium]